jgi:hypothetical protein
MKCAGREIGFAKVPKKKADEFDFGQQRQSLQIVRLTKRFHIGESVAFAPLDANSLPLTFVFGLFKPLENARDTRIRSSICGHFLLVPAARS